MIYYFPNDNKYKSVNIPTIRQEGASQIPEKKDNIKFQTHVDLLLHQYA